jgi:hypothetical protein
MPWVGSTSSRTFGSEARQAAISSRGCSPCERLPASSLAFAEEVRLKALTEWAEAEKIRPNVSHRLPLEEYAQAMRLPLTETLSPPGWWWGGDDKIVGGASLQHNDVMNEKVTSIPYVALQRIFV